ncbi:MAG: protein-L-isoaspartate(D-aspartate) O-methyltransferase [Pirellulaceae bacterium]|nr:protein-L-isoaspartate(D-aspartate) O-methyltransferase [Pirellulaceae bacterium]
MNRRFPFVPSATIALLLVFLSASPVPAKTPALREARNRMVDVEIVGAGVKNERVIKAMRDTPRHEFVPVAQRRMAYFDMALPIGHQQTISAPFAVAYMTEQLEPKPTDRVLEIGTGSGYQAAVLSPLVRDVYTIEIVEPLGRSAARVLKRLKYDNVHVKVGDGYQGWPEHAPFDKIIVTCSPEHVPKALAEQLAEGGMMIIPVGERYQQSLYRLTKRDGKLETETLQPTLFVPMTGAAESRRRVLPDPANPKVVNGDFEEAIETTPEGDASADDRAESKPSPKQPAGWHHQRQIEMVESPLEAREGNHYARFFNDERGRASQALQGFALDGREVGRLQVSLSIRGKDIRPGQDMTQQPVLAVMFYDDKRVMLGERYIGPWRGTFDWRNETALLEVPIQAREAIIRVGLFGAVGELWVDNIEIKGQKRTR